MFELEYIRRVLAGRGRQTAMIFFLFSIAVLSVVLSIYWANQMKVVMGEYQDCSWVHSVLRPLNCAGDDRMAAFENLRAKSQISWVVGIIVFLGLIVVPVLQGNREYSHENPSIIN